MYSKFHLAFKYIQYWLTASNGKGHGVHSPFVFDFINNVLNDNRRFYAYDRVESHREKLLIDRSLLPVEDFGAGTSLSAASQRSVSSIASQAAKSKKFGQLLFRIVNYFQPFTILEMGTSLGLSAAYLASGNQQAKVITLEGAKEIADLASLNFSMLQLNNIELILGNFDDTLPKALPQLAQVDLAFIDGNHRMEPTIRYFKELLTKINSKSIMIFDDIHWSKEMEETWLYIKKHDSVKLSIDLFSIGLVFFNKSFKESQHFVIRF